MPGAGVVPYCIDDRGLKYFLIANESKYVKDILGDIPIPYGTMNRPLSYLETVSGDMTKQEAVEKFKSRCIYISTFLMSFPRFASSMKHTATVEGGLPFIKVDAPERMLVGDTQMWTAHFRFRLNKSGFPKGKQEPVDEGNPLRNAIREFREEIGIQLNESKLVPLQKGGNYVFFKYELDKDEVAKIERERIPFIQMSRTGEIYNLRFVSERDLTELLAMGGMNRESEEAYDMYRSTLRGGMRKTRKTRTRKTKTRKTQKTQKTKA